MLSYVYKYYWSNRSNRSKNEENQGIQKIFLLVKKNLLVKFIFVDKKSKIGGWRLLIGWLPEKNRERKKQNLFFYCLIAKKIFFYFFIVFFIFVFACLLRLFFYLCDHQKNCTHTHAEGGYPSFNFDTHNFDSWRKMKP